MSTFETLTQSKKDFIEGGAKLLKYKVELATGVPMSKRTLNKDLLSSGYTGRLLEEYFIVLAAHQVTEQMDISNSKSVLQMLSSNKISIADAERLLTVLQKAKIVDAPLPNENKDSPGIKESTIQIGIVSGGAR